MFLTTLSFLILVVSVSSLPTDDFKRFTYEYEVLQKLVDLRQSVDDMKALIDQRDKVINLIQQDLTETKEKTKLLLPGSLYKRWGRAVCPENGTELVYTGYAGGSHYSHSGAAANLLCLPDDPTWWRYNDAITSYGALLYGAEYQFNGRGDAKWNSDFKGAHDHDVPCAVCRSRRPTMVMIPGRVDCYDSWTLEYSGYLAAGHYSHAAASEFFCLDRELEVVDGGAPNKNGRLIYLTEGRCGSLQCPPYVNGRELACVVCTK